MRTAAGNEEEMAIQRPRQLTEYLEVLWRRRLLFLLFSAAMLTATMIVAYRIPNQYEAQALVGVKSETGEEIASSISQVAQITQRASSRSFLTQLVNEYRLQQPGTDRESAIGGLRKALRIETKMRGYPEAPESIEISFRHRDPAVAEQVVKAVVSLIEQANGEMGMRTAEEIDILTGKIGETEARLAELDPIATSPRSSAEAGIAASEAAQLRAQRTTTASAIETLSDKEFALERQIAEQRRLIAEQEQILKALPGVNKQARLNPAYAALITRRADLAGQIKRLETLYTEKNPKLVEARAKLSEIDREMAALAAADEPSSASMTAEARELRAMQRELSRLETELEVTRRDLNRKTGALESLPDPRSAAALVAGGDVPPSSGRSEYDRLLSRYNWLVDKRENLQQTLRRRGEGIFQVIDRPAAAQLPVGPNRRLLQLFALASALGAGLLSVLLVEVPQRFFVNDERDIEYFLGAPVIALIPETLNPVERRYRRRTRIARAILLLLLVAALIPALIAIFNRLPVFQILANR